MSEHSGSPPAAERGAQNLGLALFMIALTPGVAWAYVDPGAGSFAFQVVLGAVVAVGYAVKAQWKRIVIAIRRLTKSDGA
jgi:hypothetical protein